MKKEQGITLIALVITIVVLLILASVSIAMLTGDSGILTQANKAKLSTILSGYKEEVDLYKTGKFAENNEFSENTLTAGKTNLSYNTQKPEEQGNIKTIITQISDEYIEKLEIIKGELLINTKIKEEVEVAKSLGIKVNPYDITEDGELESSTGNLLLVDENGTLTIPDSVTKIGEGAFANLEGLKTIIIPGSVKEIGDNAFAYNKTLEHVILKEGVEKLGNSAFANCIQLKTVEMANSINSMGDLCFYYCEKLEEITIPSKVEAIKQYTFSGDKSLKKVNLSEGLKNINAYAFQYTTFTNIVLPSTLQKIEEYAFSYNKNLNNIVINNNAQFVYESGMLMNKEKTNILFISEAYLSSISTFKIPDGIQELNISLADNKNIKKIVIPSTLQKVLNAGRLPNTIEEIEVSPQNTKYEVSTKDKILYTEDTKELIACYSKEENINIDPNNEIGILQLNDWSFSLAENAKIVILPESLIKIQREVFDTNNKIEEIRIGANVSYIDPIFKYRNYNGKIIIDPQNDYYTVENNILYNKEKDILITVLKNIEGHFEVSNTVKEIGDYAFHGQMDMTSITISSSVKNIGTSFNYCSFSEINIPSSVVKIEYGCFRENSNLNKINIDNKENSIQGAPWGATKGMKVVNWKE